ncbi:Pyridoxal phosphate-dependent transferase, major domain, partial [Sesbania bispinosa]
MAAAKEEFLKEFGEHYGYPNGPKTIDQIRATEFKRLQDSQSDSSSKTLEIVKDARQQMINNSSLCASLTSIRYALGQGAATIAVDIEEDVDPRITGETISSKISLRQAQRRKVAELVEGEPTGDVFNLFAFPSECNFSGFRFDLDLVKIIKEDSSRVLGISSVCKNGRWLVLIDAAKGCATLPPDLSKYPADFVAISFYK